MKHIEETEQENIITWASMQRLSELKHPVPSNARLGEYLVASANGGQRTAKAGAQLKKTGVRAGFPDLQLTLPAGNYYGLFIELKKPIVKGESRPVVSVLQNEWLIRLNKAGYYAVVCYGFDEAIRVIKLYLAGEI